MRDDKSLGGGLRRGQEPKPTLEQRLEALFAILKARPVPEKITHLVDRLDDESEAEDPS